MTESEATAAESEATAAHLSSTMGKKIVRTMLREKKMIHDEEETESEATAAERSDSGGDSLPPVVQIRPFEHQLHPKHRRAKEHSDRRGRRRSEAEEEKVDSDSSNRTQRGTKPNPSPTTASSEQFFPEDWDNDGCSYTAEHKARLRPGHLPKAKAPPPRRPATTCEGSPSDMPIRAPPR